MGKMNKHYGFAGNVHTVIILETLETEHAPHS